MLNLLLKRRIGVLSLLLICAPVGASARVNVEKVDYHGWKNCYRIFNGTVELVVLAEVGPRIIFYGFSGDTNEFHEFPEEFGKTGGNEWRSYGGHRLWVSPEMMRTYFPDNVPVRVSRKGDTVVFTAPSEAKLPGTNLQKEMGVRLSKNGTHLRVIHRITNRGNSAAEIAPWSVSVMEQNGRSIVPLPPKATWTQGHLLFGVIVPWSYTNLEDPRWVIGTKYLQLKQDPYPKGKTKQQKAGTYNPFGWSAYFRNGHLFVKRAAVQKGAVYPDSGCNFETYTDPGFLELESLGPLRQLQSGATAIHIEDWWLFKDVAAGEGDGWVDSAILPLIRAAR